jgi:hypothetical protein
MAPAELMTPKDLVFKFLSSRLELSALLWLEKNALRAGGASDARITFANFSSAIRHSGKGPMLLKERELEEADALVRGWKPSDWTLDQAARIHLLLSLPPEPSSARLMDLLYQTADMGEALALMKALPLLPNPKDHLARAREGARSNVKTQFEAVALGNPYPALHFDEQAWNQLVSKAVFVDSPLDAIVGLESRANKALNRLLTDLIRERLSAGRTFSPLLYRCLGPVADDADLDLLEGVLGSGTAQEKAAVVQGLSWNLSPRAERIFFANRERIAAT